ncbi:hypothetical protein EYF80_046337 [Liparis tanakae]|uniref:Uncharacterized protein n=1 Tax=Liparis tanakae TaxID=230148 RepID=A0A4Z2FQP3_9TELE|nr:hypothetical protein EYF80_046337 [Liparis tanakae]
MKRRRRRRKRRRTRTMTDQEKFEGWLSGQTCDLRGEIGFGSCLLALAERGGDKLVLLPPPSSSDSTFPLCVTRLKRHRLLGCRDVVRKRSRRNASPVASAQGIVRSRTTLGAHSCFSVRGEGASRSASASPLE